MQRQQPDNSMTQRNAGHEWLGLVFRSLNMTCEIFLHEGFGERYVGIQGPVGALLIILFAGLWPGEDQRPLLGLLVAYLLASLFRRIGSIFGRQRIGGVHTRYSGWPRILRILPWVGESAAKRFVEPLLVFGVGVALLPVNKPLGSYLIVAAVALFATTNAAEASTRSRVLDLHDQVSEQRNIAERFRDMNGNE